MAMSPLAGITRPQTSTTISSAVFAANIMTKEVRVIMKRCLLHSGFLLLTVYVISGSRSEDSGIQRTVMHFDLGVVSNHAIKT
jgi:hypothetical protein